jgi:uncharacterized protein YegL
MTDIQLITELPELACSGVTDFGNAFRLLRSCIDRDVPALNSRGRAVLRPVAFILTDGQPTDSNGYPSSAWKADYEALIDPSYARHPNIVSFGFRDATAEVLAEIATKQGAAFLAKDVSRENESLKKIFSTLLNTLVASASSNELRLPAEVDGFIRVSPDIIF